MSCWKPLISKPSLSVGRGFRRLSMVRKAAIPVHRVLQRDAVHFNWKMAHKHELVQPWMNIPRRFFVEGETQWTDNCMLHIQKSGEPVSVGLCSDANIEEILKAAVVSKFGKGSETVLDPAVRNGTEIGPDVLKLSFKRPFWVTDNEENGTDAAINALTKQVEDDIKSVLFPHAQSISLKFCKLALYQQGGHFQEHKDTAHAPNHQGTLLVEVKSKHEGGLLTFTAEDGTATEWRLDNNGVATRWCAFHTDITHKVEPVTAGVRAVLQFDIHAHHPVEEIQELAEEQGEEDEDDDDNSDVEDDDDSSESSESRGNFFSEEMGPSMMNNAAGSASPDAVDAFIKMLQPRLAEQSIALPLFHSYQHAYLQPDFLKPADRMLFDSLLKAGHSVLLTPIIIDVEGDSDDRHFDYSIGPSDPLKWVYTAARSKSDSKDVKIKRSNSKFDINPDPDVTFICTGRHQCDKYFYKEYVEHTGNEAAPAHMKYFSAAMVILQRKKKGKRQGISD